MLRVLLTNDWWNRGYDCVDRWLAEAWIELSSQRTIMTDGQYKNKMTTALSAKGEAGTLDLLWSYWVEAVEEDLRQC